MEYTQKELYNIFKPQVRKELYPCTLFFYIVKNHYLDIKQDRTDNIKDMKAMAIDFPFDQLGVDDKIIKFSALRRFVSPDKKEFEYAIGSNMLEYNIKFTGECLATIPVFIQEINEK